MSETRVYSSVPNLLVYKVYVWDTRDDFSLESDYTFIGIDHEDVFSQALEKVLTEITEMSGQTITDDMRSLYESKYNNNLPMDFRGYRFVIKCVPIDDITY